MQNTIVTNCVRAIFIGLSMVSFAIQLVHAQNATPSSHPQLKVYNDWVNKNIEGEFVRYWRIFDGGAGREPYLVYCKDAIFSNEALRGKKVRVRAKSAAQQFFPKLTGNAAQLLAAAELNIALKLGVIDCLGFGGEVAASSPPAVVDNFSRELIESVSRSLGAVATHDTFILRDGALEWMYYRALEGDLNELYNLYGTYRGHGILEKSPPFHHMAGFWGVRIYEHTPRGGRLQFDDLLRMSRGDCKSLEELCKGIQIELKRLGKYTGKIDGVIGRGTRSAISSIIGTRKPGDPSQLKTLEQFLAERYPAPAKPEPPKPEPEEPSTPKVTDNLDDF